MIWLYSWWREVGFVGAINGFLLHALALWIGFTTLMLLKRRSETHAWPLWVVKILRSLFFPGFIYDCWFNTRYGTILFLEFPPTSVINIKGLKIKHRFEPLTSRLKRHYQISGWRGNLARVFCWPVQKIDKQHCL